MDHMTDYGDRFNEACAAELRAQKGRTGYSLDYLAKSTGIAKRSVQRYLSGERPMTTSVFTDLCRALRADPLVIFERAYESIQ